MKVFIVTTEYGTGTSGGVESVVDFLLASIRRLTDWKVEVASLRMSRRATESRKLFDARSWLGGKRVTTLKTNDIYIHQVGSSLAELEMGRFMPRKWLDSLMADCDVVVVVSGTPAVCNAVRRARVPIVLQVATLVRLERKEKNAQLRGAVAVYRRITTWLTGLLDEVGLKVPSLILVENNVMLQECKTRKVSAVELCPPGVNTDVFCPAETLASKPYILMVARLDDARKNLDGLIRAYAQARENHGVTHDLVLAGMSSPSAKDFELIADLGLNTMIHVQSSLSQADLVKLYQEADLFVSASFEEGLGLTFLEAMACAVPVVTTDTAGATFILHDSLAGAVVPHGQRLTERLALELARWCHDEALRKVAGAVARKRVMSTFSEHVTAQRFVRAIAGVSSFD